jgi:CO/xanthine dehydrogenase FAD-binding subunit
MEVLLPRTLEEALEMRAARPEAHPIAGGTDVMVEINFGKLRPDALLDVSRLPELREARFDDGDVFVGAGVTYTRILRELPHLRALAQSARGVGSPQIRNRGTVGGNLGTASPAGEAIPVLAAHDAEVGLVAAGGRERWVPWDAFVTGVKRTTLAPDELILGARWRHPGGPQSYSKVGTRNAMVISIAMLCFAMDPAGRAVRGREADRRRARHGGLPAARGPRAGPPRGGVGDARARRGGARLVSGRPRASGPGSHGC